MFERGCHSVPVLFEALPIGVYLQRITGYSDSGEPTLRATRKCAVLGR